MEGARQVEPEPLSADPPFHLDRPLTRQSWLQLTFIHWAFPMETVRRLVPSHLVLDSFEGRAYVGLVPFRVCDLTLPRAPSVPWLSNFLETNVRTYVRDAEGKRGVWFFSLDAARLAAVMGARIGYALPYYWARMRLEQSGDVVAYRSSRRHGPPAVSDIRVRIGSSVERHDERLVFLTARWRLWSMRRRRMFRADVEHPRWPLHEAALERCEETLLRAAGLPAASGDALVHYSPGVKVLVTGSGRVLDK